MLSLRLKIVFAKATKKHRLILEILDRVQKFNSQENAKKDARKIWNTGTIKYMGCNEATSVIQIDRSYAKMGDFSDWQWAAMKYIFNLHESMQKMLYCPFISIHLVEMSLAPDIDIDPSHTQNYHSVCIWRFFVFFFFNLQMCAGETNLNNELRQNASTLTHRIARHGERSA